METICIVCRQWVPLARMYRKRGCKAFICKVCSRAISQRCPTAQNRYPTAMLEYLRFGIEDDPMKQLLRPDGIVPAATDLRAQFVTESERQNRLKIEAFHDPDSRPGNLAVKTSYWHYD